MLVEIRLFWSVIGTNNMRDKSRELSVNYMGVE